MNNEYDLDQWKVVWVELPEKPLQETLSAILIGDNQYQIMEIPARAENLNFMDIVSCVVEDAKLTFSQVIKLSGNRTLHILFPEYSQAEYRQQYLDILVSKGVTYNYNLSIACALNISPEIDIDEIRSLIKNWENEGKLQIDE